MGKRLRSPKSQALNWLLSGGVLISLAFWPPAEDPINIVKLWILVISASWLFGWLAFNFRETRKIQSQAFTFYLSIFYVGGLILSWLGHGSKFSTFLGIFGRRTGLLSYVALVVFFLASTYIFNFENIEKFKLMALMVGLLEATYGFFQHFGLDFVKWVNPYNSIIGTVGNPDFAAALMGIFLVLAAGIALDTSGGKVIRTLAIVELPILLITIVFSQARQGLVAAALGLGVLGFIWLHGKSKRFAYTLGGLGIVGVALGILGMLQTGPFASILYKPSISARGYYWRAGIEMFRHHPLFGVGLDRYGSYFTFYREPAQFKQFGTTVSNAAHNVPIQLAATGGIFVIVGYLAIFSYVAWRGVRGIIQASGSNKLILATVFAGWVTYAAQSIISIDNLGIAIWGWILGGVVIALSANLTSVDENSARASSKNSNKNQKTRPLGGASSASAAQGLVSSILVVIAFAFCVPLYLADTAAKQSLEYTKPQPAELQHYNELMVKPLQYGFVDPYFKIMAAYHLAAVSKQSFPRATQMLNEVVRDDPREVSAIGILGQIAEATQNWSEAVKYRRMQIALDRFDSKGFGFLIQDLLSSGKKSEAQAVLRQFDTFASETPESKQFHTQLGNN